MLPVFRTFLEAHQNEIVTDTHDQLQKSAEPAVSPASLRILESIGISADGHSLAYDQLSKWVLGADGKTLYRADLALPIPAAPVHFVAGAYNIYYDFKNTDIVLDELQQAGVQIQGALLDFGCSSGRNLAVLRRAYGDGLDLYGVDPAGASIDWLNANVRGVQASVSRQEPPLPFEDSKFDIIIAKSIWTHFSPGAGRRWFAEMARILKKGGHFLFSVHGPHDIASRIVEDVPRPKYERFAGHENWTRDLFLIDLVERYESDGVYFQPYKQVGHQGDLNLIEGASTDDWGLTFISSDYLRSMLPFDLKIVNRAVARTGNRHDVYVVRRD